MSDEQVYLYNVTISRTYPVAVKAKSKRQADEAFDAGRIQTSDIHERCSVDHVEIDVVMFVEKTTYIEPAFDVTDYVEQETVYNRDGVAIFQYDRVRSIGDKVYSLGHRATETFHEFDRDDVFIVVRIGDECDDGLQTMLLVHQETHEMYYCVEPADFEPICNSCNGGGLLTEPLRACDDCDGTGVARDESEDE